MFYKNVYVKYINLIFVLDINIVILPVLQLCLYKYILFSYKN